MVTGIQCISTHKLSNNDKKFVMYTKVLIKDYRPIMTVDFIRKKHEQNLNLINQIQNNAATGLYIKFVKY